MDQSQFPVSSDNDSNKQSQAIEEERERRSYLPLYKAALRGDWEAASRIFCDDPGAVTAMISGIGEITLHVAIGKGRSSIRFIQMLVDLMPADFLVAANIHGETPLHYAAIAGNVQAIRILVTKNRAVLDIENRYGSHPLHYAAQFCQKEAVSYLLSVTDLSEFSGKHGVRLVNLLIIADFYDMALDVLRRYPKLAIERDYEGTTALATLANNPHAFPSGSKLGFCDRLLYRFASVHSDGVPRGGDLESIADSSKEYQKESKKFGFLHNTKNTKLKHILALELLRLLITETLDARPSETRMLLQNPLHTSARLGIYEVVVEIIKAYPESVWFVDRDGRNIFHLAIIHRHKFIFSLLNELSPQNKHHLVASSRDNYRENMLHLAARMQPSDEIRGTPSDKNSGAALKMHSDMQWFKDVEKIVQPLYREMRNLDGYTPRMKFYNEHKELAKDADGWMKTIASSCMVVPTLVITVAFAAAFTVPGGNTQDQGIPIYLNRISFMIFAVSDALAFFSSSTSLLMFICIFNSDYSEENAVRSFKLFTFGFISLFFSIATMFAAFSTSLYIVLSHKVEWIAAPISLLACVPAALFAYFQFPQWFSVAYSAFKPSIIPQHTEEIIF
ncbi:uncharacterized protein LOC110669448 [Hevea brasiliensis]|uniref:uncharacterized protein LOC110669448 n=1 Tax=Hevea brasiliensis TaxID=3981 RepID=UPI0025E09FE3|nr:uncharacterized protein LOC110669448 [Hevea brasiliensis]